MKFLKSCRLFIVILLVFFISVSLDGSVKFEEQKDNHKQIFYLDNNKIKCSLFLKDGKLLSDLLEAQPQWIKEFGTMPWQHILIFSYMIPFKGFCNSNSYILLLPIIFIVRILRFTKF